MALKDIVANSKRVHTVTLHGTDLRFVELGHDAEQLSKAAGREYAKKTVPNAPTEKLDEYATLYTFLEMFRAAGETTTDAEFFSISTDYHQEIIAAVGLYLSEKVHTEGKRMQEELKKRLAAKKLE